MKFCYNLLNGFRVVVRNCHTTDVLDQRSNDDLDVLCSQIYVFSLKVSSYSFECIIVLLIYFANCQNALCLQGNE